MLLYNDFVTARLQNQTCLRLTICKETKIQNTLIMNEWMNVRDLSDAVTVKLLQGTVQ